LTVDSPTGGREAVSCPNWQLTTVADGRGAFRVRVKRHRKDGVDEAEVRMPA
jgi:hypothetical protein